MSSPQPPVSEATRWDPVVEAVVTAVRSASLREDGHDPLDEAARLHLKHHGLDGARLWLADDGFALVHGKPPALELAVAPEARSRGWGTALATAVRQAGPVTAWSHGDHPAARALATELGWSATRELWVMRRPATTVLPADRPLPEGVRIRCFDPGNPRDAAEVLRVNAAAFAHHPEQGSMDAANLAERMAEDWFDPDGLLLAVDAEDTLLGFHWTKREGETGEVYVVAIDPEAQGGGLGRALTLAGLRHLHEAGVGEVILYVESDNAPALAVYSGLGFMHADSDTHVQYSAAAVPSLARS